MKLFVFLDAITEIVLSLSSQLAMKVNSNSENGLLSREAIFIITIVCLIEKYLHWILSKQPGGSDKEVISSIFRN